FFLREDAIVALGVGKNMVRSIRHWALASGVLIEEPRTRGSALKPTPLAELLFGDGGRDPYLEDPNSLWLLHWYIGTKPQRCTTWQWAFNMIPSNEFTRESLITSLKEEMRRNGYQSWSENSLKRDIDIFLRTYLPARFGNTTVLEDSLDCPLV